MSLLPAERYKTSEIARIQVYGRLGDMVAKLKNISSTGAMMELINGEYVPKSGDFVHAIIHLHAVNKTHEVDGEVVWTDELGFGISFVKKDQLISKMILKNS